MKKALILSLTVILILGLGALYGCGNDGNSVSPNPSPTVNTGSTGTVNGAVIDRDYNKVPGAYIVGYKVYNVDHLNQSQSNYFATTADENGNYSMIVPDGLIQFDFWWNQTDHDTNYATPQGSWRKEVVTDQTINLNLYIGYFYDETPEADTGNLSGRAFEDASTAAGTYIVVNRVYGSEMPESQTNMYVATAGSQGEFLIEYISEGEIEINAWKTQADFENLLDPVYSSTGYIYAGMTLVKDVQYGNM